MADKKISDFTAVTTLAGGDMLEVETAGGNSRKILVSDARSQLHALTSTQALCSADTTVGAGAWTDITGCSMSLPAGTHLITAIINILNSTTAQTVGGKIYNQTDTVDYCAAQIGLANSFGGAITLTYIVTLAGTKTIRLAGRSQTNNVTAKRYGDTVIGGANIQGCMISAVQIA